jgi:hypothetical protein
MLHSSWKVKKTDSGYESVGLLPNPADLIQQWCTKRQGKNNRKCTWHEVNVLLTLLDRMGLHEKIGRPKPISQEDKTQWRIGTQLMAQAKPKQDRECRRISIPTPKEFLNLVATSEPVVIEGALGNWSASSRWNMDYFNESVGNTIIRYFTADDSLFEKVVTVQELLEIEGYAEELEAIGGIVDWRPEVCVCMWRECVCVCV